MVRLLSKALSAVSSSSCCEAYCTFVLNRARSRLPLPSSSPSYQNAHQHTPFFIHTCSRLNEAGSTQEPWKVYLIQLDRPDVATCSSLLRFCSRSKSLPDGKLIHDRVFICGLDQDPLLGNLLLQMYGSCGALEDARLLFSRMNRRDPFSWNFLIRAFAVYGHSEVAFRLFVQMQVEGVLVDRFIVVSILCACTTQAFLPDGKRVHVQIASGSFDSDVVVGTALVNMYGKCGKLDNARQVFDKMPDRDVVLWTALIGTYAQEGQGEECLKLFDQMQVESVIPDKFIFGSVLSAYSNHEALVQAKKMYARIVALGLDSDIIVGTALIHMHAKCGNLVGARNVFEELPIQDTISWTAMIVAYVQYGQVTDAVHLFHQMLQERVMPDKLTVLSIIDACANKAALPEGKEMHKCIISRELEAYPEVGNALINMYGKCGHLEEARRVFDQSPKRDVMLWNTMIAAYAHLGGGIEAFQLFEEMQQKDLVPDKFVLINILSICENPAALTRGKELHMYIITDTGFYSDIIVGTAVINMYGKCRSLEDAQRMFDKMPEQNVVSFTAMIAAYVQNGKSKSALQLFDQMQCAGLRPDHVTFISTLEACASIGALDEGKLIHACVVDTCFQLDMMVGNAIVNMYGKCGSVEDASSMLDKILERDVVTWNAVISVCAQNGQGEECLHLFNQMQQEGVIPNKVTLVSVLSACSHAGLVKEACRYFVLISGNYGITPTLDHFNCMIDMLGRAGLLDEAENLINIIPVQPTAVSWTALLGACYNQVNVERGECAANYVCELDPENVSPYIMLANIYAAAGRGDDAVKAIIKMRDKGLTRPGGCSSIEVMGRVHEFSDDSQLLHEKKEEIHAELQRLSSQIDEAGYASNIRQVRQGYEKMYKQCSHSEKLAVAFGLISTPPLTPLVIIKDSKVCLECHLDIKFISKIANRNIVIEDTYNTHYMKDGTCSCADYWQFGTVSC